MQFSTILLHLLSHLYLLNTAHSKIHTLFLTDDSRLFACQFHCSGRGAQTNAERRGRGQIGNHWLHIEPGPSRTRASTRCFLCSTSLPNCFSSSVPATSKASNCARICQVAPTRRMANRAIRLHWCRRRAAAPYLDFLPTVLQNGQYSTQFAVRFNEQQKGFYFLFFHNCFNYREHGYSDRVAVDLTVTLVERNVDSFLSIEDIPKPNLYIYFAFVFALATIFWANLLCKADGKSIFKVHRLMLALVFLKSLTLLFHGVNFYFVSAYGHERELWAIIYYVTHLLKGALLFGTIILIGTGYTFFKRFLGDRDRRLFMFVLPLQILDNIAMIILEESEFGDKRYLFWLEMFTFLDLVCCMSILLPILWSIGFLTEGAAKTADGKAAFNLERLRLFRRFYLLVIAYIYTTRGAKFMLENILSDEKRWISGAFVELASLFFFCLVGAKFRPQKSNPYLRLSQEDWAGAEDAEAGVALTTNGLFEKVKRKQRLVSVQQEEHGDLTDRSTEDDDDNTLLPKTGRDMGLSSLLQNE
uniref:Protein GPR107 n=1 Tax=Globodera rostochiensis TaxID=31243 RepID=A0A914I4N7_GLORO